MQHMSLKCGSGVCGYRFVDGRIRQRVGDFELWKNTSPWSMTAASSSCRNPGVNFSKKEISFGQHFCSSIGTVQHPQNIPPTDVRLLTLAPSASCTAGGHRSSSLLFQVNFALGLCANSISQAISNSDI